MPNGTIIAFNREPMPGGGTVTTYTDITERKRAEEATRASEEWIRTIMDNLVDGIIVIDESGRMKAVNPACEKMVGLTQEPAGDLAFQMAVATPESVHPLVVPRFNNMAHVEVAMERV